jgi:hypothetical protein
MKTVFSYTVASSPVKIYQCFGETAAYIFGIEENFYEELLNFYEATRRYISQRSDI